MAKLMKTVFKIINAMSSFTGIIGSICIFAAAIIVTEGVIMRKLFGTSTYWQIEASTFLLIYVCFMGAPYAQKHERHLNVDLAIIYLPPRVREILLIFVSIVTWLTCGIIAYYAWPMWWEAFVTNENTGTIWAAPLWIPYFFLPLGMTLMFLQYIVNITNKINDFRRGEIATEISRMELKDIEIPVDESVNRRKEDVVP